MHIAIAHYFIVLLLFCCLTCPASAKEGTLSDKAQKIRNKFIELRTTPDNTNLWEEYLKVLPQNKTVFKLIFDPDDFSELYDNSHEYILILNNAPETNRKKVIELVFSITKMGAPGCCDAWSALHSVAVTCAIQDTTDFLSSLKLLKTSARQNVIKFIADKENHMAFKEYKMIIDKLKNLQEQQIVKEFENARALRMTAKH